MLLPAPAVLVFASALTARPPAQDAIDEYRLAVGLAERGFHDRAAEECAKFLREHPDHEKAPYVRYRLGQAYVRTGAKDRAQEEFAVYQKIREQHLAELDRQRAEIRQFVYAAKNGATAKP